MSMLHSYGSTILTTGGSPYKSSVYQQPKFGRCIGGRITRFLSGEVQIFRFSAEELRVLGL